jgi:hypothetical protein
MSSSFRPERLDLVVLWRLSTVARVAPTHAALQKELARFAPDLSVADVEASIDRLRGRDHLEPDGLVSAAGKAALAAEVGVNAKWVAVADSWLPAFALGYKVGEAGVRKSFKDRWTAAIVARHYGFARESRLPPTGAVVANAIVWRRLGLPGTAPHVVPATLVAAVLGGLLGRECGNPTRGIKWLADRATGATRSAWRVPRDAVVRTWLSGRDWTEPVEAIAGLPGVNAAPDGKTRPPVTVTPPAPVGAPPRDGRDEATVDDLTSFARRVREAALHANAGVFGDRKVFISALWRSLDSHEDLETFKRKLVEANRRGLLHLHRADLVQEMDPAEVAASATPYMDATFHFVEREETP